MHFCQDSQNGVITSPMRVAGIRLGGVGYFDPRAPACLNGLGDAAMDAAMANPAGADEGFVKSFFGGGAGGAARGATEDDGGSSSSKGGSMWTALLSMVGGGGTNKGNINPFASELAAMNQAEAVDNARRRNMGLLFFGVGVVGFAGLVYLLGRK